MSLRNKERIVTEAAVAGHAIGNPALDGAIESGDDFTPFRDGHGTAKSRGAGRVVVFGAGELS